MKLRLQGNSVRLRLTRPEVERLRETGLVEESVDFGAGEALAYRLQTRLEPGPLKTAYRQGIMTVSVSREAAQAWAGSDEVGLYSQFGALAISVEKDFRCLTRPRDDERDAYPHPGQTSETAIVRGGDFMPIVIGAKRESDFTDPIGMLGDCHRRIEMFLNVLVRVAEQARGEALNEEQRGALETALRYFREAAPKHTADEEESLFPRLRQIGNAGVRALMARIESLEEEHVCADRSHSEVDNLGRLWLRDGTLPPEQASRLLTLLLQLRDLYRHHIATEDNEVFPTAAAALSAADREAIGGEMASRRSIPRKQ